MNPKERQKLIDEHTPLVRAVANRKVRSYPHHVEVDDLVSEGVLGLIDAVDKYDPARGVPFRAYAELRVAGAIIDYLRKMDWVPRTVRRRAQKLDRATSLLRQRLGRPPTHAELAEHLEMSEDALRAFQKNAVIYQLDSLDKQLSTEGDATVLDTISSEELDALDRWVVSQTNDAVRAAIEQLAWRERVVVELYYVEGKQLKEIGERLEVSESRVCQLRGQAVRRLKAWVEASTST